MRLRMQDSQDHVQSYFGMRQVSLGQVPGESNPRILLNNLFLFQMGVLDQVSSPLKCLRTGWVYMCCMPRGHISAIQFMM